MQPQEYEQLIAILRDEQEELERRCTERWRALNLQFITASDNGHAQSPNEVQALAQMELATSNMEVARLRNVLDIRTREYEAAMAVMQGRVHDGRQANQNLGVIVSDLRDQLLDLQAQQAAVEGRLATRESNVTRREHAIQNRENSMVLKEEKFEEESDLFKQQVGVSFYEYIRDGWAHYADGNFERSVYWFNRALELPGLEPSLLARGLMCMGEVLYKRSTITYHLTSTQCFVKVLETDPTYSPAWNNLGASLTSPDQVIVGADRYTTQQCFVKSLDMDPTNALAWYNLGTTLAPDETVTVRTDAYTSQQCYLKALEFDPSTTPQIWYNLGVSLLPTQSVRVGTITYNSQQCYTKALEVDCTFSLAWFNLGVSLTSTTMVRVGGEEEYTKCQCYIKAVESNPTHSMAWNNLGGQLANTEQVTVGTVMYTCQQCFVKAVDMPGLTLGCCRLELGAQR